MAYKYQLGEARMSGSLVQEGDISPGSSDGGSLGSAASEWSDMYLADGSVVYLGDDQEIQLQHIHDTGLRLSSSAGDHKLQLGDGSNFIRYESGSDIDITSTGYIDLNSSTSGVRVLGNRKLFIGGGDAADSFLIFDGNAQDFRIGIDDGTDILEIGGGSAHGSDIAIKIDSSENVDIASHNGSVGLKLAGTLVTSTATEINLLDGGASIATKIGLVDGDGIFVNDGGTSKLVEVESIKDYVDATTVQNVDDSGTLQIGFNYFSSLGGAESCTLPASPAVGNIIRVKAPSNCSSTNTITINKAGSQTIDGNTAIVLESPFAAVNLCYVANNTWSIF